MSQDYRPSVVSLVGATIDGKYSLLSILGEGGMGAVYKAVTPNNQYVALKVLHQELGDNAELKERFQREIQALFQLRHPNVLAAHDSGFYQGAPYLVMELLEGAPLDKFVEDNAVAPDVALGLFRQILSGLAFAHAKGAAHRDLKAENVFISNTPQGPVAKLLDFGLVKFTDEAKWGSSRKLTVQGSVFGTPAYMAPEQAMGQPADARTDVYSAGCILFELLTGEWPFMEETQMMMLQSHIMKKPRTIGEVNLDIAVRPELEALYQKAMAKKPPDRFVDAGEMMRALEAIPFPAAAARPADGSDPFRHRTTSHSVPMPVVGVPVYPSSMPSQPGPQPAMHPTAPAPAGRNNAVLIAVGVIGVAIVLGLAVVILGN